MNILILNHYAGAPELGMEFRPYYLSREWIRAGHKVLIIGATYSHLRKRQPKKGMQNINGINYYWISTNKYKNNGIGRILSMFLFVFKAAFCINRILDNFKPDAVIASSTYPLDIFPSKKIADRFHVKLVYEVHDLWPLSPMELGGYSKHHPFIKVMQFAENYAYKHCQKVVSILPLAKEHMVEHGLAEEKFFYIPNGIEMEIWQNPGILPVEHQRTIDELKDKGRFLIGYAGAHGLANSLYSIIDAAAQAGDQKVSLLLVGDGQEKKNLITHVKKNGYTNIHFMKSIDKHAIPTFLKQMDVLILGLKNERIFRFGISPNKLFDYMMSAKPIIQAINAGNDLVSQANCGISVEPENIDSISNAMFRLKSLSDSELDALGKNGYNFVNMNHNYQILAMNFISAIQL